MREVVLSRPSQKYWDAVFNNPFPPLDLLNEMTEKVDIPSYLASPGLRRRWLEDPAKTRPTHFWFMPWTWPETATPVPEKLSMLAASGIWLIRWLRGFFNQTLPEVKKLTCWKICGQSEEALWGQKPLSNL